MLGFECCVCFILEFKCFKVLLLVCVKYYGWSWWEVDGLGNRIFLVEFSFYVMEVVVGGSLVCKVLLCR